MRFQVLNADRKMIKGQALTYRAWSHFQLGTTLR